MKPTLALLVCLAVASSAAAQPVRPASAAEVAAIRSAMQSRLKDADSAKFLEVRTDGTTWCGRVNSKNSYGAYEGFTSFLAMVYLKADNPKLTKDTAAVIAIDDDGYHAAAERCAQKGF